MIKVERDYTLFSEAEWDAIEARLNRPPKERFEAMIQAGIIDRQGNVLIRMPRFESDEEQAEDET